MPLYTQETDLQKLWWEKRKIVAESMDPHSAFENIALVSQTVYYMMVPLLAGQVITTVGAGIHTGSVTVTLRKAGVYDKNGVRLAQSTSETVNTSTGSIHTLALSASLTITADDVYYLAWLENATTPSNLFGKFVSSAIPYRALNSGPMLSGSQSSQTDLPSTGTISIMSDAVWLFCYKS